MVLCGEGYEVLMEILSRYLAFLEHNRSSELAVRGSADDHIADQFGYGVFFQKICHVFFFSPFEKKKTLSGRLLNIFVRVRHTILAAAGLFHKVLGTPLVQMTRCHKYLAVGFKSDGELYAFVISPRRTKYRVNARFTIRHLLFLLIEKSPRGHLGVSAEISIF